MVKHKNGKCGNTDHNLHSIITFYCGNLKRCIKVPSFLMQYSTILAFKQLQPNRHNDSSCDFTILNIKSKNTILLLTMAGKIS